MINDEQLIERIAAEIERCALDEYSISTVESKETTITLEELQAVCTRFGRVRRPAHIDDHRIAFKSAFEYVPVLKQDSCAKLAVLCALS